MEKIPLLDYTLVLGEFEKKGTTVVFKGMPSSTPSETKETPAMGIILYPILFKDGRIKATVKFDETSLNSACGIIFDYFPFDNTRGSPYLQYAGITNSDGYIYVNTYQANESKNFSYRKQNLIEPQKEYELVVDIRGYFMRLYVNDVLVGYCNVSKSIETNIGLHFLNIGSVHILNLEVDKKKPKAFVVMQFSDDYKPIYEDVIRKVCEDKGFDVIRGDESLDTGMIISDITRQIEESSVIIADITPNNPNVFYEVGYAHALRKPTILMSDKTRGTLPFDVSGFRTIFYENKIGGKNSVEKMLGDLLDNVVLGK